MGLGSGRTTKMKKLPPLWGIGIIWLLAPIWVDFTFVQDMHWNYFVVLLVIPAHLLFLAVYWFVYANNKSPDQAIKYLAIWAIMGFLYRILKWPATPLEDFLFFDFPFSSGMFVNYLAMINKKRKEENPSYNFEAGHQ